MKQEQFRPGYVWLDENQKRIEAHGGCMYYENERYYWIGEDKSHTSKRGRTWTWGIRCYSSSDLYNWHDEGYLLPPVPDDKKSLMHPNRRIDRPHILKNEKTGKYVIWLKYNDKSHFSVFTADRLLGPYTLETAVLRPYGRKAGDFDLAADQETGQGYLFSEVDHKSLIVCELNEEYTDVTQNTTTIYDNQHPPFTREGVCHFTHEGKHYLLTSGMTGYVPNPSEIAVSDDWMGPYQIQGDPCVNDTSGATFNSQLSNVFKLQGSNLLIAMADRWVPEYRMTAERTDAMTRAVACNFDRSYRCNFKETLQMLRSPMMGRADTSKATYVWLPITWKQGMPALAWQDSWKWEASQE